MITNLTETATFKTFKEGFGGDIVLPMDTEYEALRGTFVATDAKPAAIARPLTAKDVAAAIHFASATPLQLSIRSGKHSAAGFSTNNGGLVLDLAHFNAVEVLDAKTGLVRLGAGALWGDVATKLDTYHLAISSGDTKSVGVGGLTLGGGIGWMVRKYGYAIDSLVAAEVVLADGSVVRASETENSDLFWSLRGGGGNFGVVTNFEFRAHPQGNITSSVITYDAANLTEIASGWRNHMRSAPEDLTSFMTLLPGFGPNPPAIIITSCYASDDQAAANIAIDPLRKLGEPKSDLTVVKPYAEMLIDAHPQVGGMQVIAKDMFMKVLDDEVIAVLSEICCKPAGPIVQLRMMNGAADKIDVHATAMAHRNNEAFLFAGFAMPLGASNEQAAQSLQNWQKLAAYSSGAYSNFISTNSKDDVADIYPPATYQRLAKIKQRYDPENIFNHNFNIIPAKA